MIKFLLLIGMLFCHIVDDYYLQGWLASAKQKSWWEKNCPNPMYKNDYLIALIEHAFSWTCMIHFPIIVYTLTYDIQVDVFITMSFFINWIIHSVTDNFKANLSKINLIQDQLIHIMQIFVTWMIFIILVF